MKTIMNLKWLPSMCTILNLGAGATSLLSIFQEHYRAALMWIVLAACLDVLDGLLARGLHCISEFGKQLDSLADLVSFGVAPAFLILLYQLPDSRWIGPIAAITFLICGAVRLARFNLTGSSNKFIGLPITAAGLILAAVSLSDLYLKPYLIVTVMGILSVLMVSHIPFPSLKTKTLRK